MAMQDKFVPKEQPALRETRLASVMIAAGLFAALAVYAVPRGIVAHDALAMADDPVRIADHALAAKFNSAVATREIKAALADNDADLARSFVDLAVERHVTLDPVLTAKVNAATAEASSTRHTLVSFARGFVTGVPEDGAALAGTALGDLFVFGDIRDAAREGTHWALGEPTDKMILGLAGVGLAITAGTYATAGLAAPARIGLTLAKVAHKTGRLSGRLALAIGRMVRQAVDWSRMRRAIPSVSPMEPAAAAHAARDAVKVERAGGLLNLASDIGRIERKASARAAMETLQIAQTPAEVSRVAKLAAKEGGKTRAIIKLLGRGAIMLTIGAFDLGVWILGALFTLVGFIAALKGMTERVTLRLVRRRKERRRQRERERYAALIAARA